MSGDRAWLRYFKVHGCVTLGFWLALLALVALWAGREMKLW